MDTNSKAPAAEDSDTTDIRAELDLLEASLEKLIAQFDQYHAAITPRHTPAEATPGTPPGTVSTPDNKT